MVPRLRRWFGLRFSVVSCFPWSRVLFAIHKDGLSFLRIFERHVFITILRRTPNLKDCHQHSSFSGGRRVPI
ncbi:hypothetical protein BDD12DRAFT_870117 [Trichophaea hybrida]|nr:hypothetical protein BDD12DRAFT_870117 [Trichophaea hybrida]